MLTECVARPARIASVFPDGICSLSTSLAFGIAYRGVAWLRNVHLSRCAPDGSDGACGRPNHSAHHIEIGPAAPGVAFLVMSSPGHPLLAILEGPNVIVTPHVGWASQEAMQSLWTQVIGLIRKLPRRAAVQRRGLSRSGRLA